MHFHLSEIATSIGVWTVIQYAFKTIPMPPNKYAQWLIGVIQFGLANSEIARQNFSAAGTQQKVDDLSNALLDKSVANEKISTSAAALIEDQKGKGAA